MLGILLVMLGSRYGGNTSIIYGWGGGGGGGGVGSGRIGVSLKQ